MQRKERGDKGGEKMKNKTKKLPGWALILIVFGISIILLIIFFNSGYLPTYEQEINDTPLKGIVTTENRDDFNSSSEMHWGHMPLIYKFENESNANERLKNLMRSAFRAIENETNRTVYFLENSSSNSPDISIYYGSSYSSYDPDVKFVGGTYCYSDNLKENLIVFAGIYIYGQGWVCNTGYPSLEIHEILHTFNFYENPGTASIMFPYTAESSSVCKITHIDQEYISCLKNIYSNGKIMGNCSNINTIRSSDMIKTPCLRKICQNGYYYVIGEDICCPVDSEFIENSCYQKCEKGYIRGQDYQCYLECGKGYYCLNGSICYEGKCRIVD